MRTVVIVAALVCVRLAAGTATEIESRAQYRSLGVAITDMDDALARGPSESSPHFVPVGTSGTGVSNGGVAQPFAASIAGSTGSAPVLPAPPVPEPLPLVLLGVGLFGLAGVARRRLTQLQ